MFGRLIFLLVVLAVASAQDYAYAVKSKYSWGSCNGETLIEFIVAESEICAPYGYDSLPYSVAVCDAGTTPAAVLYYPCPTKFCNESCEATAVREGATCHRVQDSGAAFHYETDGCQGGYAPPVKGYYTSTYYYQPYPYHGCTGRPILVTYVPSTASSCYPVSCYDGYETLCQDFTTLNTADTGTVGTANTGGSSGTAAASTSAASKYSNGKLGTLTRVVATTTVAIIATVVY